MKSLLPLAIVLAACTTQPSGSATPPPTTSKTTNDGRVFEVIALKYSAAEDVAGLVRELVESSEHAEHARLAGPVKVTSDPRTNSIVLAADARDLPRLRELVARLDVHVPEPPHGSGGGAR